MKKIITLMCSLLVLGSLFVGCEKEVPEDVISLKSTLTQTVKDEIKDKFDIEINPADFDIEIGEKVGENTFENLKSIDTKNDIYLIGNFKDKPKTITEFMLVYNPTSKKVTKIGVKTLDDDDIKYINID